MPGGPNARPKAGSLTGRVWEIADQIAAEGKGVARSADVLAAYLAEGGHPATGRTQFSRWKNQRQSQQENPAQDHFAQVDAFPDAPQISIDSQRALPPSWDFLLKNGFKYHSDWQIDADRRLTLERAAPSDTGVYAFVINDEVVYIGVADIIRRRIQNYRSGHMGQRTSFRINKLLLAALDEGKVIRVLFAIPGQTEWNGLPVELSHGLEKALIARFTPRWNMRS